MSIDQTLLKLAQQSIAEHIKRAGAEAFLPMPGGQPPMDPAMAGGAPPMDPAMMGGAPPMDPAMAGGAMPPMDPAMMGGAPPMDPAMMGGGGMPPPPMDPAMAGGAPPVDPAMMAAMAAPPAPAPGGAGLDATTISLLIPIIKNAVTEALQGAGDGKGGKKEKKQSAEDRLMAIEQKLGITPQAAPAAGGGASAGGAPAPAAPPADPLASIGSGPAPSQADQAAKTGAYKEKDEILASIERLRKFGKIK